MHRRDLLTRKERLDCRREPIVQRAEQRGGWNRVAEVVVEEVAQAAGRLQFRHVGMQIQAIEAPDGERHVVVDNGRDVGRHQTLLGGMVDDGTARRTPMLASVPTSSVTLRLKPPSLTNRHETSSV